MVFFKAKNQFILKHLFEAFSINILKTTSIRYFTLFFVNILEGRKELFALVVFSENSSNIVGYILREKKISSGATGISLPAPVKNQFF